MPNRIVQLFAVEPTERNNENRGQFHHRIASPAALFANSEDFQFSPLSLYDPAFAEIALNCDLLIIQNLSAPEIETVIRWRKEKRRPTVYEIADNFLAVGNLLARDQPLRHPLYSSLIRQNILFFASLCDGLQFSSPGVAEIFTSVNSYCGVLDNYVPVPERLPEKEKESGFVFGWGGTRSHREDLAAIAPAIISFCRRHRDVKFAFMGNEECFQSLFAEIPTQQVHFRCFGAYDEYMAFLRSLHVGIAPLQPTAFNRGRTDVKFIEFTVNGTVAVLSDIDVYRPHRDRAPLFRNGDELLDILDSLYTHPYQQTQLVQTAFAWVQKERNTEALREQRRRFYAPLLEKTIDSQTSWHSEASAERIHRRNTLLKAWELHESKNFEDSLSLVVAILQTDSHFYQAQWLLVKNLFVLKRYAEILEEAEQFENNPIYSDLIAETAYHAARQIAPHQAQNYWAKIQSPIIRTRLQYDFDRGDRNKTDRCRAILRHQPYDFMALLGLIHLLEQSTSDGEELNLLRKRSRLLVPERL